MNDSGITKVTITDRPLDDETLGAGAGRPEAGASVVFTGTVRNQSPGKPDVTHLEYEAYPEQVEGKIRGIVDEARTRWDVLDVSVSHRTGTVAVGEPSVVVAVSAAHRDAAFSAARYVIDELKHRAPIWKKEFWAGGAEWIEGA